VLDPMPITESGITLDFPDTNFFRFEKCKGYKHIQDNLKEMDVCWYDKINDILYIIELKDWGNGILDEESDPTKSPESIENLKRNISQARIHALVKKSLDSVCMFASVLLNKPYAVHIQACSPFVVTHQTTIKLLSIINWNSPDSTYLDMVNTAYKSKFKPYAKLFNISSYLVLPKTEASQFFAWVK
jgi:hypothetical protein